MTQETTGRGSLADGFGLLTRFTSWRRWAIRVGLVRKLMLGVTFAAVVAGVLTVYLLLGSGPTIAPDFLWALLFVDLALLLSLIGLVTWWLIRLWALRRAGVAGARLHGRLIAVFAVLAIMPAITVAALAAMFFNFEVRSWFSDRVREAVNNSVTVAEAYLGEHKRVIAADALAMANDLNREWASFISNQRLAGQIIETQAALRALQEAIVFDASGRLIARSGMSFSLELSRPDFWALEAASDGEVVILTSGDDRVRALVGLQTVPRAFLYVGRFVDPRVVGFMEKTQEAASEYQGLQDYRARLQVQLAAIFVLVALFLLLVAVAAGLGFANRLARPMGNLVHAAERVRDGDLSVRVEEQSSRDEFGVLTRAFNRMTRQLEEQRGKLMDVNRQLDDRRLFIETVLAGVSAGVVGLDADGRVNLPNRSAVALLGIDEERLSGARLGELVPGMAELLDRARASPERLVEDQVNVTRDGRVRTLLVRIAPERGAGASATRYVVTFDDITELLSAQRKAAWADVARRIAHEIKNPLTPIQLSAERLQRKYLPEIRSDPDTFRQCTDTIVRQVGDIGQMIDEFSSFARMPRPAMRDEDLRQICREAIVLQRSAHNDVDFQLELPSATVTQSCDRRLVAQALTNLLQNAVDAIEERAEGPEAARGHVVLRLVNGSGTTAIVVEDNGGGLPEGESDRLTEPYVTTRASGTGLGLAIVRKIMEEHGGDLILESRDGGGARVTLAFADTPKGSVGASAS